MKNVRDLLRKCCAVFKDFKTRRQMTRKNVLRVVQIYDEDDSGKIEWDEFLNIMFDLSHGSFMDRVTGMMGSFF